MCKYLEEENVLYRHLKEDEYIDAGEHLFQYISTIYLPAARM